MMQCKHETDDIPQQIPVCSISPEPTYYLLFHQKIYDIVIIVVLTSIF